MKRLKTLKSFFIASAIGFIFVTIVIPGWNLLSYFISFMLLLAVSKKYSIKDRFRLTPKQAVILFIILSWFSGMMLEALLPGVGGMHSKTIPSFILAQGYYWPFALIMLWLIKKHHFTFWEAFFAAGLASIWESTFILRGVVMTLISPFFFLAPFVFAMYTATYGIIVGLPLLFINEKLLWAKVEKPISLRQKLIKGIFIAGIGSMVTYVIWLILMNVIFHNFDSFSDILGPTNATNLP